MSAEPEDSVTRGELRHNYDNFIQKHGLTYLLNAVLSTDRMAFAKELAENHPDLFRSSYNLHEQVEREQARRDARRIVDEKEARAGTDLAALIIDRDQLRQLPSPDPLMTCV